jgi:MFS family permease
MAAGTGLLVGPILGGWIYATFGYFWCYICLAGLIGCDMVFTYFYMPNSVNNNDDECHENETAEEKAIRLQEEQRLSRLSMNVDSQVKYSWFIFNRRALFALTSCAMVMIFENFKSAFMTVYLEEDQGVQKEYHGWIIAIPPFFYVISGNVIGHVIDKAPRRIFMFTAFIIMSIALFLMGPSSLLGLPNKLWIFFVGYAVNGLSTGFVFIPILPEVIEAVYIKR